MPETRKKPLSAKQPAKKRKKKKTHRVKRFFRRVWSLFNWYYAKTTDPEEREVRIKPRLMGRTVTYAGFMIMMAALIVLITLILNNSAVGVDHEQIVVTGLSGDFEGYKILVISDLNGRSFGQEQSTLMRRLTNESYSCVLILGDMVGPSGSTEAFYTLLEQLGTRKPVYFIAGDSDPSPILETPRDNSGQDMTLSQMVLADWVLGAMERGATYLDTPLSLKKGTSTMWLIPDMFLNLNVTTALDAYKDELEQQNESFLEGVSVSRETLPLTTYRRNQLFKTQSVISSVASDDLLIMLSHEAPSDSQLLIAQEALSAQEKKSYFMAPDVVFSGHYCGGEWKLPLIGTLYVQSNILPRYGWFPDEKYVQGQRSVGGTIVYTAQGLGNNAATVLSGRLNNPPRVTLVTLTGELPPSMLD
ncbi:MAG: metallophosphoesterase [Clostridia bacterium]|nr:metallophosphoesterase [Clostridia bacterium]